MKRELAYITGLGVCIPQNHNCEALKQSLLQGNSPIRKHRLGETDIAAAGFSEEEIAALCKDVPREDLKYAEYSIAFLYKALDEAFGQAGLDWEAQDKKRVAFLYGTCQAGLSRVEQVARNCVQGNQGELRHVDFPGTLFSFIAKQVASKLGIGGSVLSFSSACAASNNALGHASDLVRNNEADLVIVAALDVLAQSTNAGFYALQALIGERCSPFSTPTGLNLGEGAGVIIVENSKRLGADALAEKWALAGYALSGDAYHITAPAVDGDGAKRSMRNAMDDALVSVGQIDYIKAHGTGTSANDTAESKAFLDLFGGDVHVSSLKAFLGHTLGASGVLDIICFLLLNEEGLLPPNYNFKGKREHCSDLKFLSDQPLAYQPQTIIANSFAFGGNNSSCILTRDPAVLRKHLDADIVKKRVYLSATDIVHAWGNSGADVFRSLENGGTAPRYHEEFDGFVSLVDEVGLPPEMRNFKRSPKKTQMMIKNLENIMTRNPSLQRSEDTGIIGGNLLISSIVVDRYMTSVYEGEPTQASAFYFPMTTLNTTSGVASIAYPIIGYNTTLVGGVGAISYGYDLVRWGRQKHSIVAASDDLTPPLTRLFQRGHLQSRGPASSFSASKLNLAEKASSVVFSDHGGDGSVEVLYHSCRLASEDAYETLMRDALACTEIEAGDLGFVVSTGGGPGVFAASEERALRTLFSNHPVVTSVAAALGYGLSSNATTAIWFAHECLDRGYVPLIAGLPDKPYTTKKTRPLPQGSVGMVVNADTSGLCSVTLVRK